MLTANSPLSHLIEAVDSANERAYFRECSLPKTDDVSCEGPELY